MMRRWLNIAAGLSLGALVAGCGAEGMSGPKHLRPVTPQTVALMNERGMDKRAPILMRIFKAEARLEVWKQQRATGQFALLRTYEICRWSGDLGPKVREGDRQAPEGFYTVTPALMNPNSSFHLAFNTGFPNAFDRAHNRTGSHLMVHGDCSSRGCFAMTDQQVEEIFALARDAFEGGQRGFQLQIMPFEMTARNMHRFRYNQNIAFWRNIKEGADHFEVTRREPQVNVCERRYTFNRVPTDPSNATFSPTEACPPSAVPPAIVAALETKHQAEARQVAELIQREQEQRRTSQMMASLLPGSRPEASASQVPAHNVFVTRQNILASLPPASPEALSLLPGAEAGPTPELRRIARGEMIGTPMIAAGQPISPAALGAPASPPVVATAPTPASTPVAAVQHAAGAAPSASEPASNPLTAFLPRLEVPAFLGGTPAATPEPTQPSVATTSVPLPPLRPAR
jgi:murein L,D-transpeptidase YafK